VLMPPSVLARRPSDHLRPHSGRGRLRPLPPATGTRSRGRPPPRAGPLEKPVGRTEIARRAFQEERHLAIDPALSVAFRQSGEAPRAAVSLAATPSSDEKFPGVTALPASLPSMNRALEPWPGRVAIST
jgi:hypothetical protein